MDGLRSCVEWREAVDTVASPLAASNRRQISVMQAAASLVTSGNWKEKSCSEGAIQLRDPVKLESVLPLPRTHV
jgi:hypothetical protein